MNITFFVFTPYILIKKCGTKMDQMDINSSSGCFELNLHLRQWIVQSTLLFLTVVCSPSWEKIMKKSVFPISEFMAADLVRNGFVTNLLRFYCGQLVLLTWILLKMFRELLSEEYIEITDNLLGFKIWN